MLDAVADVDAAVRFFALAQDKWQVSGSCSERRRSRVPFQVRDLHAQSARTVNERGRRRLRKAAHKLLVSHRQAMDAKLCRDSMKW